MAYAQVAVDTTLHEYAFLVELIVDKWVPRLSVAPEQVSALAEQFWAEFDRHHLRLTPYGGVVQALAELQDAIPDMAVAVLTDCPEDIAVERLSILGVLPYIDGIVAVKSQPPQLEDPALEACVDASARRIAARIELGRQLQLQVAVAPEHAKPSAVGLGVIVEWLQVQPGNVFILGDKTTKEGLAAVSWHNENRIRFLRAAYGDVPCERHVIAGMHITSLVSKGKESTDGVLVHQHLDAFPRLIQCLTTSLSRQGKDKDVN
jgi:phosphoglycolate phosphatase-like HAD superfamily hydrolase